jgi:hypothetical protein
VPCPAHTLRLSGGAKMLLTTGRCQPM